MGRILKERHKHPVIPRLTLDLRTDSPFYQTRAFIDGRQRSKSTQTTDIRTAFRIAESWYKQELRGAPTRAVDRLGLDPVVGDLFDGFRATLDKKRQAEADKRWGPIRAYWAAVRAVEVNAKTFRDFFNWRRRGAKERGTEVGAHTLSKDVTLVRQVLKFAVAEEQLDRLPAIPKPGTIESNPRPWLSPAEWDHLRAVSKQRIAEAPNARTGQQRTNLDHFMRFMVASCARVDEVRRLRYRDCRYRLSADGKTPEVLVCTVTGKRGTRDLVAESDAVEIVLTRDGKADDFVFAEHHRDALRELFIAASLRTDVSGRTRNSKSLRCTAISLAVLAGKDVAAVAKNAGTSLAMINDFYIKRLSAEMFIRESHPVEIPVSAGRE